ncbi:MAG: DUF5674 family protein, partial [Candidatus Moraniibacteriota bacterium]
MQLVTQKQPVTRAQLSDYSQKMFGGLVKAVLDIEQEIMFVDAEMHADEEMQLLENGSKQDNLWGINLYPEETGDDFIEFDSMINVRPRQNNRSRSVESEELQEKIRSIV